MENDIWVDAPDKPIDMPPIENPPYPPEMVPDEGTGPGGAYEPDNGEADKRKFGIGFVVTAALIFTFIVTYVVR